MKAEITISRMNASGGDDYIALKVIGDDGSRTAYEVTLEDFALLLTGQRVAADMRVSPPRIRNRV